MVIRGLFDHVLRRCEYTVLVPNIKEVVCATCMILDQHLSMLCAVSAIVLHYLNKVLKLHVKPGKDFKAKLLIVFYFIVVVVLFLFLSRLPLGWNGFEKDNLFKHVLFKRGKA